MTTSPNPNRADEARRLVNATGPLADTDIVALAQVHATLALVEGIARIGDLLEPIRDSLQEGVRIEATS